MKENVSKANLVRILTSLTHDPGECERFVKLEVGGSSLIREIRAGVSGVEREVNDWWQLAKVSKQ